ncbi:hypothetical protein P5673_033613 [Acropora cervicornis]|uniref:Uncharacterized protein n=1 Tax=Acropora cervicornis TaxID=6130 RepID=A0AAD9PPR9_ACRCE|nr:hypothetical protein P5673_033613 [Acropora cervicornis]
MQGSQEMGFPVLTWMSVHSTHMIVTPVLLATI